MLVCLATCSCKVLKYIRDIVIHVFHIRVMFVSNASQGFDVIVNVVEDRF